MIKRGLTLAFVGLIVLAVSAPWATSQQDDFRGFTLLGDLDASLSRKD